MTSKDLKDLLQTMATEGTDRVEVDDRELIPRIRSRRRRRAGVAAAVSASTAVVIAAAAFAVLPGGDQNQPPVAAQTPPQATVKLGPGWMKTFACGASFTAPIAGDPSLQLAVAPQVVTRNDHGGAGPISVTVTNETGKPLDLFDTPAGPSIVVVKDGVVVATPLGEVLSGYRWKFAPGETTLEATMSSQRCTADGLSGGTALEPGSYQIYAVKNFREYTDVDPAKVIAAGGPWTIELK